MHVAKEDESDEEVKKNKMVHLSNTRCLCCKEMGHSIDDCPRDPNIKKNMNAANEIERIGRIKDFRKLHADTQVQTTHLLKKCVMVPVDMEQDGTTIKISGDNIS
jgi:hypothetical protein